MVYLVCLLEKHTSRPEVKNTKLEKTWNDLHMLEISMLPVIHLYRSTGDTVGNTQTVSLWGHHLCKQPQVTPYCCIQKLVRKQLRSTSMFFLYNFFFFHTHIGFCFASHKIHIHHRHQAVISCIGQLLCIARYVFVERYINVWYQFMICGDPLITNDETSGQFI